MSNWPYRVTELKASQGIAYMAFDISDVKPPQLPPVQEKKNIFYTLESPVLPFYMYVLNRNEAPTEQSLFAMYKSVLGSGTIVNRDLSRVPDDEIKTHVRNWYYDLCHHLKTYIDLIKSGLFEKVTFSFKLMELYGVQYVIKAYGQEWWITNQLSPGLDLPANTHQIVIEGLHGGVDIPNGIDEAISILTRSGSISW